MYECFYMMFQVLELPELEKEINVLIRLCVRKGNQCFETLCEQFDHISKNTI